MDYQRFISLVEREAELPHEPAEQATRAVLQTLGERLSGGEAHDIAEQLPSELATVLDQGGNAQGFDRQEFVRRVAERAGIELPDAVAATRAVFAALGWAVSHDEIVDMAAELPKDFGELVELALSRNARRPMGSLPRVRTTEEFVEGVAQRAGLVGERERARRATEATLETLGERISHGEVDDLAEQLPAELRSPLARGDELSGGAARPLSLDEFLLRVAEREGETPLEVPTHARAVFATLREAVSEREFADIEAQLPNEYAALLARP
ncbi:MAG: hypothetical protein JWQ48_997 [Conexibacter sp.]|nr:hypothetical protein [Conexibacter sp.]